jgi:hypothetical protein
LGGRSALSIDQRFQSTSAVDQPALSIKEPAARHPSGAAPAANGSMNDRRCIAFSPRDIPIAVVVDGRTFNASMLEPLPRFRQGAPIRRHTKGVRP